jgi:hypothetical protein
MFPVIPEVGVLGFFLQADELVFFIREVKDAPEGSAVFDRPRSIEYLNQSPFLVLQIINLR